MNVVRRLPRWAWDAILLEIAVYRSLGRWVIRRPDVPTGATAIGYSQLAGPMILLWIFGSAVEVVVVDVVVSRWVPGLRIPLLAVGIWGVLWMIGLYAAYQVRPHVLTDAHLRAQGGLRSSVTVPLASIAAARSVEHELPGIVKALHLDDDLLLLGVSSRTNLELVLNGPTALVTSQGELTASRVGLWVDEPRDIARLLGPRLPA